jgi:4-hydroxy-tetrahydrodipicolinate synthase
VAKPPLLEGVLLPIVTPLSPEGSLDEDGLEQLCQAYLDEGVTGIVALGTTGEPSTLRPEERQRVIEICARACRERRAPCIVGPGSNDTAQTITEVQHLAEVDGVVAALCVVPYYSLPGQAGVVAHFEALAEASPVPIIVYNIPSRTAQPIEAESLLRLARHPNVIGVKQSLPLDLAALRVLAEAPSDFAVLCGEDAFLLPSTLLGGAGAITALAHVCTRTVVALISAARAGRLEEARRCHETLLPIVTAFSREPGPVIIKAVLHAKGHIASASVRLPYLPAARPNLEAALKAIEAAGG